MFDTNYSNRPISQLTNSITEKIREIGNVKSSQNVKVSENVKLHVVLSIEDKPHNI